MDPIVTFLEELLPLLDEEESDEDSNTAETGRTELQQFVMEDEDYFLPFRECAPSRARLRDTLRTGPVEPQDVLTVIRSLLIFRGITFNTSAAANHDGWFETKEQWYEYRGSGGAADEANFVNPKAYGPTDGRMTENFETFWQAAVGLQSFLQNKDKDQSFTKVWDYIVRNRKLPTFGPLSSFLLVEDLVYAGLVAQPTLEEFAACVGQLKKGAKSTLEMMIPGCPTLSADQAAKAFIYVFK
ncbi:hypothetical protein BDZ89DRAFT_948084 [Hymenopellis radicata]|nr:hypothetical protein BDZ89DRAFT_948084 [Hymenopellis radicata]